MNQFCIVLIALFLSISQCLIPELNLAVSTPVLNQELAKNLGPKIVDIVKNTTINQTFS